MTSKETRTDTPVAHRSRVIRTLKRDRAASSSGNFISNYFGCHNCTWIGTKLCPHDIKKGERHANGTCNHRIDFAKQFYEVAGTKPAYFQMEKLFMLREMENSMFAEWINTGKIPRDFVNVTRTSSNILSDMRKQQEGIKVQQEVEVTISKFREVVDAQYKEMKKDDDEEEEDDDDED